MAKQFREAQIEHYLISKTADLISDSFKHGNGLDAINTALDLRLDRANVSKELNKLWKKGSIIKIQGKPVLYLSMAELEKHFPDTYIPSFIPKGAQLSDYLKERSETSQFEFEGVDIDHIIGADGSLSDQILKCKASVAYPPYGLHTIIHGKTGTGKSLLANCMVSYAIDQNLRQKNCPAVTIHCRNNNDAKSFEDLLTGTVTGDPGLKGQKGILQKCENGFIILEEIENLAPESIEFITSLISHGRYARNGDSHIRELKTMFICTTNLPLESAQLKPLVQYLPTKIELLDINYRGAYEKLELIIYSFAKEAKRISHEIHVPKDILACFESMNFEGNITECQNEIKDVCSRAFLDSIPSGNEIISVATYHLSSEMLSITQENTSSMVNAVNLLSEIHQDFFAFDSKGNSTEFDTFRQLSEVSANHRLSQFINEFNIDINSLSNMDDYINENISTLQNCGSIQLNALRKNIDPRVLKIVNSSIFMSERYQGLKEHPELLYGILLHITNTINRLQNVPLSNARSDSTKAFSEQLYPEEYRLAKSLYQTLAETYGFTPANREIDFMANYLVIARQYANKTNVAILVIAHGDHIASNMVSYINQSIKGNYYLDAIDFLPSLQLKDCMELACLKATRLNQGSGVLVCCDMEPLTTISDYIFRETGIQSKTLYPLTMPGLINLVNRSMSSINNLEALASDFGTRINSRYNEYSNSELIKNVTERIIAKTVLFIDVYKAVDVLIPCLEGTVSDLGISNSNDLTVKYLCHCVNMLERVIKRETLDSIKANKYVSENHELIETVSRNLEYANKTFDIKIPLTEFVYIAEMFEPYL